MPRKTGDKDSCGEAACYVVSDVITVSARGQTVLPKEVRKRMGIAAGERLAVVMHESGGKACCMTLLKAENLSRMVQRPMKAMLQEGRP